MEYTREERSWIWLDGFLSLDYARKAKIAALGAGDLIGNFARLQPQIEKIAGERNFAEMKRALSARHLDKLLNSYESKGILCVTYASALYPELLKQISEPPLVLYCKGNARLLCDWRKLAIVGSRRTPANVMKLTEEFSSRLCEAFTIVTGLADGGDCAAICGALESGKLVSVLAHGFDYVYPECNRNLLSKIIAKGLAITEYPPEIAPQKYNFPFRNRIIAGLCDGVLVVSGGLKSGTRHTARYAFEYERDVFAFPYGIGAAAGEGCNNIIKNGGKLVENLVDITAPFGIHLTEKEEIRLSSQEEKLLDFLRGGEMHIAELANLCGKKPYELQPLLISLEMKNRIADCGGNRYCAVK